LLIDHFCQIYALARAHLLVGRKGEKSTKSRRRIEFSMAAPRVPLPQLLLLVVAVLVAAAPVRRASGAGQFDVRRHLSTVTRYDVARGSTSVDSMPQIPDGCRVIHLNLVVSLLQYIFPMCSRLRPVCVQVNGVTNSHHIYNLSILCRAPFELGMILVCNAQTFYILYSLRSEL